MSLSDHLLSAVFPSYGLAQDDGKLQTAIERHGHALEHRIGLTSTRVRRKRLRMRENVVGDDKRPWFQLRASEHKELLVLVLLRVEEADVETFLDRRQRLEGVPLDQ